MRRKFEKYLMSFEDTFLEHLNFCRSSPAEYSQRLEKQLSMQSHYFVCSGFSSQDSDFTPCNLNSILEILKTASPAPELKWSNGLFLASKQHLKEVMKAGAGKFKRLETKELETKVGKYCNFAGLLTDCVSIGSSIEELIVHMLLEGQSGSNLMKAEYKYVGICLKELKNSSKLGVIILAEHVSDLPSAESPEKNSNSSQKFLKTTEIAQLKEFFIKFQQGLPFSECKKVFAGSTFLNFLPQTLDALDFDGFLDSTLNNLSSKSSSKTIFSPINGKSAYLDEMSELRDLSDSLDSDQSINDFECFKVVLPKTDNDSFGFNEIPYSTESSQNSKLDLGAYIEKISDGESIGSFFQNPTIHSVNYGKTSSCWSNALSQDAQSLIIDKSKVSIVSSDEEKSVSLSLLKEIFEYFDKDLDGIIELEDIDRDIKGMEFKSKFKNFSNKTLGITGKANFELFCKVFTE